LNILLVNPPRFMGIPVIREERCEVTDRSSVLPPYSLLQIASVLKTECHAVELLDANGLNLTWNEVTERIKTTKYDVLIFRFTPTTFDLDIKIASISKENHPKARTVGICWTLQTVPDSVMQSSVDLARPLSLNQSSSPLCQKEFD
jgi:anaerobic magnesium-protoporphyrin IX monomethyl ester cyclase